MKLKINWERLIGNGNGEVSFTKLGELIMSAALALGGIPGIGLMLKVEIGVPKPMIIIAVVLYAVGKWLNGIGKRDAK